MAKRAPGQNSTSISPQGAHNNPETVSPPKKNPGSRRFFFAAKSLPGRNLNLHFLQRVQRKNRKRLRRKNAPGSRFCLFGGKMRTMSKFKCDLLPVGPKKNQKRFRQKKTPRCPAFCFSGNSYMRFLQMALKRNPKTASPKKTPGSRRFFAAKCAPGRNSNLHSL